MDAIILAGGKGKRLRSVVSSVPKPLASVNGKPFLDILLEQLNRSPCIGKVVLAVGYKSEQIISQYENCSRYNFDIQFSVEDKLLGTGGAIKKAIAHTDTDNILVLNGDSYVSVNISGLIHEHEETNASMTMVLSEVENANRYGSVQLGSDHRIIKFEEKKYDPTRGLINAGIYAIKIEIFDTIDDDLIVSMEHDIIPGMLGCSSVYGYVSHGKFIDIGTPETYRASAKYLTTVCGC
jgi:D-glycero-alpha-D-manno-heptose 1-phosphate guanylyltransferase